MESRSCNPSEQKSTSLPYSFRADRVTVHVSQGSVVDVRGVDAIVNAAWSDQGDIVGIDSAISDKAGDTIKEEYRKYVIKHGSLQEGETLVTSAGELKYKGIIHCVKPKRWSSNSEKEEYVTKLNKAILNIFHEAENHGFFKIAMPAMRAGKYLNTRYA
ncbi:hypothetical protein ACJMK2_006829 [Sinanodonta woodiana]|uniref:Macro domain-containing protein n=1 Tax=Sinanodonta woodiana TaxID=1069815 RepID=A0ABD3VXH0_SINWO